MPGPKHVTGECAYFCGIRCFRGTDWMAWFAEREGKGGIGRKSHRLVWFESAQDPVQVEWPWYPSVLPVAIASQWLVIYTAILRGWNEDLRLTLKWDWFGYCAGSEFGTWIWFPDAYDLCVLMSEQLVWQANEWSRLHPPE